MIYIDRSFSVPVTKVTFDQPAVLSIIANALKIIT